MKCELCREHQACLAGGVSKKEAPIFICFYCFVDHRPYGLEWKSLNETVMLAQGGCWKCVQAILHEHEKEVATN